MQGELSRFSSFLFSFLFRRSLVFHRSRAAGFFLP